MKETNGIGKKKSGGKGAVAKRTAKPKQAKKKPKTEKNDDDVDETTRETEETSETTTTHDADEDEDIDELEENSDDEMINDDDDQVDDEESSSQQVDLDKLWMHFREFDWSVANFVTLELELVEIVPDTARADQAARQAAAVVRIKPHLFYMVISDFNQKLALVLKTINSSASRIPGFGVSSSKPSSSKHFLSRNPIRPLDLVSNIYENTIWNHFYVFNLGLLILVCSKLQIFLDYFNLK